MEINFASDAELAEAYWRNMVAMWRTDQHSEDARGAFAVVDDGVFLRIYSHLPQFWRHQALLVNDTLRESEYITAVAALVADFQGRSAPLGVAVGPGGEPRANNALALQGFRRRSLGLAMGRDLDPADLPTNPTPPGLVVSRTSEYIELAVARAIISEVFDTPLLIRNYLVDDLPYAPYIAELDGVAVAAATMVPSDGIAGIYSVATLPPYRGRGIATAMLDKIITDATTMGLRVAVLGCFPLMVRHYQRSGFRVVGTPVGYLMEVLRLMFDPADDCTLIDVIERLAAMVKAARRVVMLTGAGISTESGIPDFRSPGGLWDTYRPIHYVDYMRKPAVRSEFWSRSHVTVPLFANAQPNAAHYAVAAMQQAGQIDALITQNVDGLHQRAGSPDVLELHGSYLWVRCTICSMRCTRIEVHQRMALLNSAAEIAAGTPAVPNCTACGGLLKPDVVFFGENVPADITNAAISIAQSADLFLVVGSSLAVYSGYRLPLRAIEAGAHLALVNLGPTRIDNRADLLLRCRAGVALPLVAARVC